MPGFRHLSATLLLLAGLVAAPFSACAAQSYDNCAGFIDTLPATISTQGVWCLRHDLGTAITSGNAILIDTNNVTIDCNDFKVSGLAAGTGTQTHGIHAVGRLNATVRHCNIRGFLAGVSLYAIGVNGGHAIEDNRFEGNTNTGVYVEGNGSVLRRNQVNDTGGSSIYTGLTYGIYTLGAIDVLDNTVSGVLPTGGDGAIGIYTNSNPSGSISGNRVRGLVRLGFGKAYGIYNSYSDRITLDGNHVIGGGGTNSDKGLICANSHGRAKDNIVNGFGTGISGCGNDGNVVVPP